VSPESPPPSRSRELAPVRHDVHRLSSALRAHEAPTPGDRRELQFVRQAERREGERLRILASRVRARHEQAVEAVAFQVCDGRGFGRHWCFAGCGVVCFHSCASFRASAIRSGVMLCTTIGSRVALLRSLPKLLNRQRQAELSSGRKCLNLTRFTRSMYSVPF
jgi:hypothetical protein